MLIGQHWCVHEWVPIIDIWSIWGKNYYFANFSRKYVLLDSLIKEKLINGIKRSGSLFLLLWFSCSVVKSIEAETLFTKTEVEFFIDWSTFKTPLLISWKAPPSYLFKCHPHFQNFSPWNVFSVKFYACTHSSPPRKEIFK